MKSFSFQLVQPVGGEHFHVQVRFGDEGSRALLGTLTMTRSDWRALRECALGEVDPDDLLDEVVLVPGRERCPGSFEPAHSIVAAPAGTTGRTGQCDVCGGYVDVVVAHRGALVADGHPWPHRWKLIP